jgi:hypothetical protein
VSVPEDSRPRRGRIALAVVAVLAALAIAVPAYAALGSGDDAGTSSQQQRSTWESVPVQQGSNDNGSAPRHRGHNCHRFDGQSAAPSSSGTSGEQPL